MTARELRLHLATVHDLITRGWTWDEMQAIHADVHGVTTLADCVEDFEDR